MSKVTIAGDVNGTGVFTIAAPNSNVNRTITLPDATGTLVNTGSTSVVTPVMLAQPLTLGTAQATTSGTSIDFTGIPSWVKRIAVMLNGVSSSGASGIQIQLGVGSVTTSGYVSTSAYAGTAQLGFTSTTGLIVTSGGGVTDAFRGLVTIATFGGNVWISQGGASRGDSYHWMCSGSIAIPGILDRIRITTVNGTDTFDAGSVNIMYE